MPSKLAIDARLLGRKRPILSDWAITLPLDLTGEADLLPLRDLLTQVVLAEVAAFQERQEERRLARILGPDQIAAGVSVGKVDLGERELHQSVDIDAAVATALQAFEDGRDRRLAAAKALKQPLREIAHALLDLSVGHAWTAEDQQRAQERWKSMEKIEDLSARDRHQQSAALESPPRGPKANCWTYSGRSSQA